MLSGTKWVFTIYICNCLVSRNMSNFHPLEVVARGSGVRVKSQSQLNIDSMLAQRCTTVCIHVSYPLDDIVPAPCNHEVIKAMICMLFKLKVKVQVYSLISSLKTYQLTLHFTPRSPDLLIRVQFQLHGEHTVLQPFRRIGLIVYIAISVLPGTHFYLSQVKHLRVKCLAQGHNIETMSQDWEGRNMIFLWKSYTKRDSKPPGRQRHRQSAMLSGTLHPWRHVPPQ